MFQTDNADRVVKELSSLELIEPVTPSGRRAGRDALDILRRGPRRRKRFLSRVQLLTTVPIRSERSSKELMRSCETIKAPVHFTYEVECQSAEQVESIARIVGARSIGPMPVLRALG